MSNSEKISKTLPPEALKGPETAFRDGTLMQAPADAEGNIQLIERYTYDPDSDKRPTEIPIDSKAGHPYTRTDIHAATKERKMLLFTDDGAVEYLRGNVMYRFDNANNPGVPSTVHPLIDARGRQSRIQSSVSPGRASILNPHASVLDVLIAVDKVDALNPADPARLAGAMALPEDPFAQFDAIIERSAAAPNRGGRRPTPTSLMGELKHHGANIGDHSYDHWEDQKRRIGVTNLSAEDRAMDAKTPLATGKDGKHAISPQPAFLRDSAGQPIPERANSGYKPRRSAQLMGQYGLKGVFEALPVAWNRKKRDEERQEQSRDKILDTQEAINLLSYADILAGTPAENARNSVETSASGRRYTQTLKEMANEVGKQRLLEIAKELQSDCVKQLEKKVGMPPNSTHYANSISWVMWDLAKQRYMHNHPAESNARYSLADPLGDGPESAEIRQQIVERHIGWELEAFLAQGNSINELTGRVNAPAAEDIVRNGERNAAGRLRSHELVRLGRTLTR